jgi:hypothetical protein
MTPLTRRTQEARLDVRGLVRWQAQYMVAGYAALGWFECRVIDVARMGAGLELDGPWPAWGDWDLIVRLQMSGEACSLQLRGHVRNESACDRGRLRVGIEFFDMTPLERDTLDLALGRQ